MVRERMRVRFRKAGDLRMVSHHDLLRCFERILRRAALPYHATEGFNPKPRMAFALSLPLGVVGGDEVLELELDEELSTEDLQRRLAEQAPPGLTILSVQRIDRKTKAQVHRAWYRLAIPPERVPGLAEKAQALLAAAECWIERTRPQPRRLDIRPYLSALRILPDGVELEFLVTPHGTARPDEVLALLGLGDLLADGACLERIKLELYDELEESGAGDRLCSRDAIAERDGR